ncbi:hypothetical protein RRG08_054553 [Elysia crispata]|uniref:Integrase zinc-binding domain-containing protein n=1 Tax=Elysia crispata TaxID=231223 RepID=A0AAE1E859_9GAST|nr:hypothetical protein RRG08_054553 [Elysia crispata]
MLRRVYWPGIHSEVKTIANTCESCQEAKPRNFRMPLIQHNKGASPLEKVATDLFEIQGRHYMDQYEALLELRSTPRQGGLPSPAQLMFGRTTRTLILQRTLKGEVSKTNNSERVKAKIEKKEAAIARSFNRGTRQLPELQVSQPVYYQNPEKPEWKSGQILKKKGTRSYEVQGENDGTYIRNRIHLRRKETPFQADPGDEKESALADAVRDPLLENFTPDPQPNDIPASAVSPPSSDRPKCDRQPPKWMKDFVAQ